LRCDGIYNPSLFLSQCVDPWTTLTGWRQGQGLNRTFKFVNAIKEENEEKAQEFSVHVVYLSPDNYEMTILGAQVVEVCVCD